MARMDDGFQTLITFSENGSVKLYEKGVQPPGIEGGGANETTTMRNTTWRTKAPKKLKSLTDSELTVAYDAAVYPEIIAMINVIQTITITFEDGATLAFHGWIDQFEPDEITEGEQPEASVTMIPSNQTDAGVEAAPVYTAA